MKKILQIDGGGLKGIIPATVLAEFEKKLKKPCCEVFDLITGTSTGAIIGGVLASGSVSAETILKMYLNEGSKLFTPKNIIPLLGIICGDEKYDRKPFLDLIRTYTNNKKMKEAKTLFMATAMNLCSGRTHFIYSNDDYEKEYTIADVISWSALSAPVYFGKINVPEFEWDDFLPDGTIIPRKGAVFQDGGQGINNCTLGAATTFAIAKKWIDEKVLILSLGCGDFHNTIPYEKASSKNWINQVIDYISQARNEASIIQILGARYLSISRKENYTLIRINCSIPKKIDVLDGVKYIENYKNLGQQIKDSVPFELFE